MCEPGATSAMCLPVLEKGERRRFSATDPTASTPSYAAGYSVGFPSWYSLPIAATTVIPARARRRKSSASVREEAVPPRLRLMTLTPAAMAAFERSEVAFTVHVEVAELRFIGKDL